MAIKYGLRFNPDPKWNQQIFGNRYFLGIYEMCKNLAERFQGRDHVTLCEIGSYMGESTFIFAAQNIFNEIHCIEPFEGSEEFNALSNRTWDEVKREFWTNTRHWDHINLHQTYSYKMNEFFADKYFDVVYIDGDHEYDSVIQDLTLYMPKLNDGGVICGHDYSHAFPEVQRAIQDFFGKEPEMLYQDSSWMVNV